MYFRKNRLLIWTTNRNLSSDLHWFWNSRRDTFHKEQPMAQSDLIMNVPNLRWLGVHRGRVLWSGECPGRDPVCRVVLLLNRSHEDGHVLVGDDRQRRRRRWRLQLTFKIVRVESEDLVWGVALNLESRENDILLYNDSSLVGIAIW
jgi:hypothetical protein